jgi:DNA-binding NtrC family response regulator
MSITIPDLNLKAAERMLCERALHAGGSIVEAAQLLGITRHALKRRIVKYRIHWPPPGIEDASMTAAPAIARASA